MARMHFKHVMAPLPPVQPVGLEIDFAAQERHICGMFHG
jgi:hypothetical protein